MFVCWMTLLEASTSLSSFAGTTDNIHCLRELSLDLCSIGFFFKQKEEWVELHSASVPVCIQGVSDAVKH